MLHEPAKKGDKIANSAVETQYLASLKPLG